MMSHPGKQTVAIDILPNISRSKGNRTMEISQLRENNMRKIFLLEKPCTKCGGKTSSRPISEDSKVSISLDQ